MNNGPCALGASDPNAGKSGFVEVVVQKSQPTYFAKLLGFSTVAMAARAEAARATGPCIIALDPTGANAISVDLLASVNAPCGILDESTASGLLTPAFSCLGSVVKASEIDVAGGNGQLLCAISPTPHTGYTVPTPRDPLASLAKPTMPACGTSTSTPYHGANAALTISGTAVLYPDYAYCGGITILPGANVTLQPGRVYVEVEEYGDSGVESADDRRIDGEPGLDGDGERRYVLQLRAGGWDYVCGDWRCYWEA